MLLGLIVAFSWPGLAIGLAAVVAFLLRTPVKLAAVDRRRHRSLARTRLAVRVALAELGVLCLLAVAAVLGAGTAWLLPVVVALPLVGVELWFDVRSRSRRLVPELAGAIGIAAVVAAIVIAGAGDGRLAVALWMVVAARALASIPYVRTQIVRMRRESVELRTTDLLQVAAASLAAIAALVDPAVWAGAAAVVVVAVAQSLAVRRPHIPPVTTIGVRQMVAGSAVVACSAAGILR